MQTSVAKVDGRVRLRAILILFVLCCCGAAIAAREFVMPESHPANSYPAHDEHATEKVAVAVDPYDVEYKASIFSINFRNYGYLPVYLVVTNDGDQPVELADMKAQLNTVNRHKLYPSSTEDLVRRMSHPSRSDTPNPLPIPLPGKKVKGTMSQKSMDEIERAQFAAKAVEPHSSARGFLFFDVSDIPNPLAGANLYLTGVRDAKGTELMYFEISLEKYLSAPQPKQP